MFVRFIAKQLRKPSGLFGRFVMARFLNKGNRRLVRHVLDALQPADGARILDVGFGGGGSFHMIWERAPRAHLLGADFSEDMVRRARRAFRNDVAAGRLDVVAADAAQMPYDDASIDAVLTVNTVYFWSDPEAVFEEIRRVLKPGGRLVVGFRSAESLDNFPYTQHGFVKRSPAEVRDVILRAGFAACEIRHLDQDKPLDSVIAVAHR